MDRLCDLELIEESVLFFIDNAKFALTEESVKKVRSLRDIHENVKQRIEIKQRERECRENKKKKVFEAECQNCGASNVDKVDAMCIKCHIVARPCKNCGALDSKKHDISKHPCFYHERCEFCITP